MSDDKCDCCGREEPCVRFCADCQAVRDAEVARLRAEVEQLRRAHKEDALRCETLIRQRNIASDGWRKARAELGLLSASLDAQTDNTEDLAAELVEARAEVERLRAELEQLEARVVRSREGA